MADCRGAGDQSDPSVLQDVFKESRSQDHMEAKTDAETQFRSRKLPLTRKIYAFYRAPIVKFWSNTVGPSRSTGPCTQPCTLLVYQSGVLAGPVAAGSQRMLTSVEEHLAAVSFTSMSRIISHRLLRVQSSPAAPGCFPGPPVFAATSMCRSRTVFPGWG